MTKFDKGDRVTVVAGCTDPHDKTGTVISRYCIGVWLVDIDHESSKFVKEHKLIKMDERKR
jgi:hypothetical protein